MILVKTTQKLTLVAILLFVGSCSNDIPEDWDQPINLPPVSNFLASIADWSKPYPALRVIGNLFAVVGNLFVVVVALLLLDY